MNNARTQNENKKKSMRIFILVGCLFLLLITVKSTFFGFNDPFVQGKLPTIKTNSHHFGDMSNCPDSPGNSNTITCSSNGVIYGTNHADTIFVIEGSTSGLSPSSSTTVYAKSSDDLVSGSNGDDTIFGQAGDDILQGNPGKDRIDGGAGNDVVVGGVAEDFLSGGDGDDRLFGDESNDILQGGRGADQFDCGAGTDTVLDYSSSQGDTISGNCEIVNT